MKILTYDQAVVYRAQETPFPGQLIQGAMDLTMKTRATFEKSVSTTSLKFLIEAGHTSILEHVCYTFVLENVSRSFLAQITRHRMGSFTSASQHYTDYRDMPMVVSKTHRAEFEESLYFLGDSDYALTAFEVAARDYVQMIDIGVPIEEARQVLPNAAAVTIMWTVNARSLLNFFEQRLCKRNVEEMQIVAQKVWLAVHNHWPEFAELCGPYCFPSGQCNQGKMSCGMPYTRVKF